VHNPGRAAWEAERYRIVANSVGQQGNYVAYASARDAQKAAGLQKAIDEIDAELQSLDGQPVTNQGRADILRGDRQRFTEELKSLQITGQPDGATNERELMAALPLGSPLYGEAPAGFDYAVPEKYNTPRVLIPATPEAMTAAALAMAASLTGQSVPEVINEAITSTDEPKPVEVVDPFDAPRTEGDDIEALEGASGDGAAQDRDASELEAAGYAPSEPAVEESPAEDKPKADPDEIDVPF
jgi:hypothetical protein